MTLPIAALYAVVVWMLARLLFGELWLQLALFAVSVYLLVELSNQNALLRVRSRMVSTTFILLSCTACFLFPQLQGAIVQLCFIVAFLMLFQSYQDKLSMGSIFYAFACVGIASLAFVQVLWYVPLLWILMATQLQSLSGRTWLASLIGLVTPYWFCLLWLLYQQDFSLVSQHFSPLADFSLSLQALSISDILVFAFVLLLSVVGIIHFWSYSFEEKIRIRLIYGFFTTMTLFTLLFIILQPQYFDVLIRVSIVCASPLVAHVFTFTNSRLSNILFFVSLGIAIAITAFNLWNLLSSY